MTPFDVACKSDWEGGVWETACEYGLDPKKFDTSTEEGELLARLWRQLQEIGKLAEPIVREIEAILDEATDNESENDND